MGLLSLYFQGRGIEDLEGRFHVNLLKGVPGAGQAREPDLVEAVWAGFLPPCLPLDWCLQGSDRRTIGEGPEGKPGQELVKATGRGNGRAGASCPLR